MKRELIEFQTSQPAKVESLDDGTIVLRRVKYLGARSTNVNEDGSSNVYPTKTRQESETKYTGAKVFLDHKERTDLGRERKVSEQIGRLRPPFLHESDGSYADLHLNPHHPLAPMIAHDAKAAPDSIGLSHHAHGAGVVEGQDCTIGEIVHVQSVDVVCAGATTSGLFESRKEQPMLTIETLRAKHPELVEQIATEAVAAAKVEPQALDDPKQVSLVESLRKEVDDLKVERDTEKRKRQRAKLIADSKLPKDAITDLFVEQVENAETDDRAQALVEDRRKLVLTQRVESGACGSQNHTPVKSVGAFLEGKE